MTNTQPTAGRKARKNDGQRVGCSLLKDRLEGRERGWVQHTGSCPNGGRVNCKKCDRLR
ncbi:hypothetical protein [Parasediminibacterium sp. JCM 36343]|uniref:hypothetical protein n=1 Tax=Parasediminibacterium sp. JCM 36343 TaxID=3374279 RepID=UPI00397D2437